MAENKKDRLISSTEAVARRFYNNKTVKLWSAKLGPDTYRAFIIDEENKYILCRGELAETREGAITLLKKQLQKDIASNEW